ncbi:MAG: hypothetical protein LBU90_01115 [Bacteroidales bacterium]|jgi:hypothetical protein|nr:hypothetical protein [Bacteroidales bacterium]
MSEEIKVSEYSSQGEQQVVVNVIKKQANGVGTAGFVLALLGVFTGWIPVLGWILWVLGLILSFAGVFKKPRGLAIAGLVISCIGLVLILVVFGAAGTLLGAMLF